LNCSSSPQLYTAAKVIRIKAIFFILIFYNILG
jgi:hypothetical protein